MCTAKACYTHLEINLKYGLQRKWRHVCLLQRVTNKKVDKTNVSFAFERCELDVSDKLADSVDDDAIATSDKNALAHQKKLPR